MDRTSSGKRPASRRTPPPRFRWTGPLIVRVAVVAVAGAALIWLSLAITLSSLTARNRPAIALAWWPSSAVADASLAESLIGDTRPSAGKLARAQALAERALRREPVNPVAARMLGVVAAFRRQDEPAQRAFNYAEALSKRDLATQLILIEREVARNDIPGALNHYHRALTTSRRSAETLLPILVHASADPNIARPLAAMIARRPSWWLAFAERLVAEGRSPRTLAFLLGALRLDVNHEGERPLLISGMMRLVNIGGYGEAYGLYRRAVPGHGAAEALVRNGGFQSAEGLPPFDWSFTDGAEIAGFRQLRDAASGDYSLFVTTTSGLTGEVARQLLLLPAGRYRLSFIAGQLPADALSRPQVRVLCANATETPLAAARPDPAARGRGVADFTVSSAQCTAQWLSISSGADEQNSPWIDSVAIRRL